MTRDGAIAISEVSVPKSALEKQSKLSYEPSITDEQIKNTCADLSSGIAGPFA
jgi:hypothetical protein